MRLKLEVRTLIAATSAFAIVGCGGGSGSSKPTATRTVAAAAGATITAGAATLTIPPGALARDTSITLRETEPQHAGREVRVEMEPHDALNLPATLAIQAKEGNVRMKMHKGDDDSLQDVEVEDRNHHEFKTSMSSLHDVESETEHGTACADTCASGQECDDGLCEDHNEHAASCDPLCATGQECDDGTCKTHLEVETEHRHGGGSPDPGACTPACAAPLVCHDAVCSAHG